MKNQIALAIALIASLVSLKFANAQIARHDADVCVYGGTASGVMAALAAKKEGAKVILIEPSRWLGGMTGGGINHLDWGKGNTVGGSTYKILMDGVQERQQKHHGGNAILGIGNRQYRERFKELVEDYGITVIYEHRLGNVQVGDATIDSPTRQRPISIGEDIAPQGRASSIRSINLDYAPFDKTGCPIPEPKKRNAITVSAKVFIDCSYEGDVLAMSGASYTWGREAREHYGESLAGVRPNLWVHDIDPYIEPGNPESGLLPFIQDYKIGELGSADDLTMGYCFRYEFDGSGQGIPIPEPTNYDPAEFEVYRRAIRDGVDIFSNRKMGKTLGKITTNKKGPFVGGGQLNRNLMASTVHGCNDEYPNGDWATRSKIWKFHQEFLINSFHFAKTDPSTPQRMKERAKTVTFRKGVFDETGGWPHQLYIRQARRMVSSYVVTQKDLEGRTDPPHAVGLAAYGVDDFPYTVVVEDGKIAVQGGEFSIVYLDEGKYNGSYKIPYEAIVPRKGECENLIVPVCVSASHIAFTSLRMEPVWMVLGESAGVAAAIAVAADISVQDVPYKELRQKLDDLDQTLDRIEGPIKDQEKQLDESVRWKSHEQWNQQKKGWEWLFPHIDTDTDGQISAEEYNAFQKFKTEQEDWEANLKNKGARAPTGLRTPDKPNILWFVVDDMSANFSCYGEKAIQTPHVDALAKEGIRFTRAYATSPVCSTFRSALITGMYQTSIGAHHHRSGRGAHRITLPDGVHPIPTLFQQAGYYTCIGSGLSDVDYRGLPLPEKHAKRLGKTDYNFDWEPSIYNAHDWSNRDKDQPFFMQVQLHGGKLRGATVAGYAKLDEQVKQALGDATAPENVQLPPYYPRDPVLLKDWSTYLDTVRLTDLHVGRVIERLKKENLLENTLIIFFTDHGISHARGKQFLYDEGTHIPLIIRGPGIAANQMRAELIEHIDIAALSLAAAGIDLPHTIQGQNVLAHEHKPKQAVYAARDRCGEAVDRIRSVRTDQYLYIRNFYPSRPHLMPSTYKDGKLIVQRLRAMHASGNLDRLAVDLLFSPTRPSEELYLYQQDRFQTNNLHNNPEHAKALSRHRKLLDDWIIETGDSGSETPEVYELEIEDQLKSRRDPTWREEFTRNAEQYKSWAREGK